MSEFENLTIEDVAGLTAEQCNGALEHFHGNSKVGKALKARLKELEAPPSTKIDDVKPLSVLGLSDDEMKFVDEFIVGVAVSGRKVSNLKFYYQDIVRALRARRATRRVFSALAPDQDPPQWQSLGLDETTGKPIEAAPAPVPAPAPKPQAPVLVDVPEDRTALLEAFQKGGGSTGPGFTSSANATVVSVSKVSPDTP